MYEAGYDYNKPFRKSARVVGEVMGKYHPHGNLAIYEAMVRMVQTFSMRLPLVDGQGNFGSMDGDPPAAERYTEARLAKSGHSLLEDIDKETVDFEPNYDESLLQPKVLPARFPNLLVNGSGGIAVGMATNIPPHNLKEVIDGCCSYIENPDITTEELMQYIPGPDFPTGGLIMGRSGILDAYRTGRGSVMMRGKSHIEEIRKDRQAIIFTEIPYQVNKARLAERISELVKEKVIEGISEYRDESDRDGVRVVIELKRDAVADVVLNQLYKFTPLQTSFGVNTLALHGGVPLQLSLRDIIKAFVEFREEVVTKRLKFELRKARERAHLLVGLAIAVLNLDDVIAIIKAAPNPQTAREQLMSRGWRSSEIKGYLDLIDDPRGKIENDLYYFSEEQAKAILDLRLHRLTGLEREKIQADLDALAKEIEDLLILLASRQMLMDLVRKELLEASAAFSNPRRTEIQEAEFESDIESLIQREEMVVTVSHSGYIKRVPLNAFRAQRRGGKGKSGMATRDEDIVSDVFVANTHTPILFFSTLGQVYELKVYKLPLASLQSRGKAMVNLLPLAQNEKIATIMPLPEEMEASEMHMMFTTSFGNVRRNAISDFLKIRGNGKKAIRLDEGEELVGVKVCREKNDVFIATHQGQAIRFPVDAIRVFVGRDSNGVRGIKLAKDDYVVSMAILNQIEFTIDERESYLKGQEAALEILSPERFEEMKANEEYILTVTEKGLGKLTSAYEHRVIGRGGSGVKNLLLTDKNGPVVASFPATLGDQIMLVTDAGKIIRVPVQGIRLCGRQSQGVMLFRVNDNEKVTSVAYLKEDQIGSDEEEGLDEEIVDAIVEEVVE
jgi:DNA gyrase subunit A